jgi:anti-sigma factor RsiW
MAMRRNTEELIAAYVDGVAELTAEERARVEALVARDEHARVERDATRTMLDQLRAHPSASASASATLAGESGEPDWAALAQRIDRAVGPGMPRVWWRSWKWLVPIGALAVASVAALLLVHGSPTSAEVATTAPAAPAPKSPEAVQAPAKEPAVGTVLFLDGETVEVDDNDAARLLDDLIDDRPEPVAPVADDDQGLLPATDLGWIDNLDDASIERAEHWLADHGTKKKG